MKEEARTSRGRTVLLHGCPQPHYEKIMDYVDQLRYTSIPDYGYIYFLLKHAARVC